MGKVRFETEYSAKFKEHDTGRSPILRSPILKPRNLPPSVKAPEVEQPDGKENRPLLDVSSEAGLKSYESHLVREPPMQHKTIVQHQRNHNIIPTKTTQQFEEIVTEKKKEDIEEMRSNEKKKMLPGDLIDDFAGRPSDRVGYMAIEPPMQRKSRPNFHRAKVDHVSDSLTFDEPCEENHSPIDNSVNDKERQKKFGKVQRKLDFKEDNEKTVRKTSALKKPNLPADGAGKATPDNAKMPQPVKVSPPKPFISPSKLQRKEDLQKISAKQSERVDRALQFKAGMQNIEPPLYSHPVRTEYQKQFGWKKPVQLSSPVLSAEKFVFKSDQILHPEIPLVSSPAKKTEYQSVFISPSLKPESPPKSNKVDEDQTPKVGTPAGLPSGTSIEDRRREKQSLNKEAKVPPPRPKQRYVSEYRGNYGSPSKFKLKRGAWLGDYPPQLQPDLVRWETESDKSDWFKEVVRLRERARAFRARTEETHFPTTFGSPAESLCSSRSASVCSDIVADSLENDKQSKGQNGGKPKPNTELHIESVTVPKPVSVANGANSKTNGLAKVENSKTVEKRVIEDAPSTEDDARSMSTSDLSDVEDNTEEDAAQPKNGNGRLPTPRLRAASSHRRHHLDPTTPAVGGALLVSPSKYQTQDDYRPRNSVRMAWTNMDENGIISDDPDPSTEAEESKPPPSKPTEIAPGKKTHRLEKAMLPRDQSQRPPKAKVRKGSGKHAGVKTYTVAKEVATNDIVNGVQKASRENGGYDSSKYDENAASDDPLSPSSMSARSSVISDILDRSVDRRNNFWR